MESVSLSPHRHFHPACVMVVRHISRTVSIDVRSVPGRFAFFACGLPLLFLLQVSSKSLYPARAPHCARRLNVSSCSCFFRAAAKPGNRVVPAGIPGRNSCFAPPQSPAGSVFCTGSSVFLRVRRRDGAADTLPARLPRQENRKSRNRASRWLSVKSPAAPFAASPLASDSASRPAAPDESWPSTSSHPHKYCRHRAIPSGPAAAL